MKTESTCSNRKAACAAQNPNAHLVEIFNQVQQDFMNLKANEVMKFFGESNFIKWWIGARMKSGAMHWTHSNIKVSFWPPGESKSWMNGDGSYECGYAISQSSKFDWTDHDTYSYEFNPICQIN